MRMKLPSSNLPIDGNDVRMAYNAATIHSTHTGSTKEAFANDVQFALPKIWAPQRRGALTAYGQYGTDILRFDEDATVRNEILLACRNIYKTHPVISAAVNVYSRYPIRGVRVEHRDPDLQRFYEELFLQDLAFEDFFMDIGQTFWVDGSAYVFGNWSDELGLFVGEDLLDPLDIYVTRVPFTNQEFVYLVPSWELKEIVQDRTVEGATFRAQYPEMADAILRGEDILISSDRLTVIANKDRPSDLYGTPTMLRAWDTLRIEDRMHSAMLATADRLYAPLIMFTVGGNLPDGGTYIPSARALDAFRDNLDAALASNFRAVVTHSGVQSQEVIRQSNLSSYKNDIDMYDERILMAYGLSTAMFKPGNNNTYASSALEFQLAAQLLTTYQQKLIQVYNRQAALVAQAQGHYEHDDNGEVVYERREIWDEDEQAFKVKNVPKLDIPEMKFETVSFKDEQEERKFRMELQKAGIPISNQDIAIGVDIDLKDSEKRYNDERIKEKMDESRRNFGIFISCYEQKLPIPPDVAKWMNDSIPPEEFEAFVDKWRDIIDKSDANYKDIEDQPFNPVGLDYGEDWANDGEWNGFDNGEGQRPNVSDEQRGDMPKS